MYFQAPNAFQAFQTPWGNFQADQNGLLSTSVPQAIVALLESGCTPMEFSPIANPRDFVDCGDFSVNPFQRNIPGLAAGNVLAAVISSAPTYFADRFSMVGGASSAIVASLVADPSLVGYNQCLKMSRQSGNANTAAIYLQHVIETADAYRAQGQVMTLSFYAKQGANYSGGPLSVQVATGAGVNQSAALLNSGGWTGQGNAYLGSVNLTTAWVRYQMTMTIPTTATQLGLQWFYTPTGAAGADDSVSFQDIQFEIGTGASPCERLDAQFTLEIAQRFAYVIAEPANNVIVAPGSTLAVNAQTFSIPTPVQLIKAPTVTLNTGGFKVASGAAGAMTSISPGTTHTQNMFSVMSALTAAAGAGALLMGGGGAGYVVASADF